MRKALTLIFQGIHFLFMGVALTAVLAALFVGTIVLAGRVKAGIEARRTSPTPHARRVEFYVFFTQQIHKGESAEFRVIASPKPLHLLSTEEMESYFVETDLKGADYDLFVEALLTFDKGEKYEAVVTAEEKPRLVSFMPLNPEVCRKWLIWREEHRKRERPGKQ